MHSTSVFSSDDAKQRWFKQQADQTLSRYRKRIAELEASIKLDDFGQHGARRVRFSVASQVKSWSYFSLETTWAVFCALASETREKTTPSGGNLGKKGSDAMTLASLFGGTAAEGARAIAQNVEGFDILGLDFDLGHFTKDEIEAKCRELGVECIVTESYSSGTTRTDLVWATFDEQGEPTTSEFAEYAQREFNVIDHDKVIAEQCESYLVDVEGYDAERLGEVTLAGVFNSAADPDNDPVELSLAIDHAAIPKTRVFVLLNERVEIAKGERVEKFKERYKRDVYDPIAAQLGHCDPTCSSIERRWYWRTQRPFYQPAAAAHVSGAPLEFVTQGKASAPREERPRGEAGGAPRTDWRGFLAAAAAADLIEGTDDKRSNKDHPLVAVNCPFRSSHGKSKTGVNQLIVHDAEKANRVPVVKCHSATCQGHERKWEEYLSALFADRDVSDPKYWLRAPKREWVMSKGDAFIVPWKCIDDALAQMNELWAVVGVGAKTRYVRFGHDGQPEFFDKTNFCNMYEASKYEVVVAWNKDGSPEKVAHEPFAPLWLSWVGRRQYAAGYGFFPDGKAPEGCHNMWRGLSVTPMRGSWQKLKRHVWENVCQRDPDHFRWLIGWLAQLFQHPEIKPGTHLVLRGKEGVGKSKLGEWIIRALSSNAMTLTSGERLVGRFNAHFESLLFALAEEVFWAGDKKAEGVIKALATANEMDYERKGIDPAPGRNYTRLMIASNEPWVVPAWSGGRRWFVLEVGDSHEKDFSYFAAIDDEMENGGLQAMLYDLLNSPLADTVNVREVPVTEQLIEQRKYSADPKRQWLRDAIERGGFICQDYDDDATDSTLENAVEHLYDDGVSTCARSKIMRSAKPYFDRAGMPASEATVAFWLEKELGGLFKNKGKRLTVTTSEGKTMRPRTWEFAPLTDLQAFWFAKYGEDLSEAAST